jgi:hypothetical protein
MGGLWQIFQPYGTLICHKWYRLILRTGNSVQFVEHDEGSWRLMVEAHQPLVEAIRRDGIELVSGSRLLLDVA